ncbi:MAG: hypothetical protein ABI680_08175 [Chthoniobacteraceae bacterium]
MNLIFRTLILAIFLMALFAKPSAMADETALYNRAAARSLTVEEQRLFGPKSGRYKYDARMIRAAKIAAERARKHSTKACWRYVKQALLEAEAVDSYPKTVYAKQAATELANSYGFKQLRIRTPEQAPVGSVLVYGGKGAGHVEIRTRTGYVSDFASPTPSPRPLIGVFVKPKS